MKLSNIMTILIVIMSLVVNINILVAQTPDDIFKGSKSNNQLNNKDDSRPNILVVYVDDLDHLPFGFMDNPVIQTPNIDQLTERGVTFKNAFVNTATCVTSRGNFMTGQYAARTGIYFDGFEGLTKEQTEMIYPAQLQKNGYYTGYVGKWHLKEISEGVFDSDKRMIGQGEFWSEDEQPNGGKHLTDRLGSQGAEMIKEAPTDQPFAITVGFKAPHVQDGFHPIEPYPSSPSTAVLYERDEVPAPVLSDSTFFANQPDLIKESLGRVRWDYRLGTPESLNFQRSLRRYYRMVTGIDNQLGKMVEALQETNRADNTIILFTSDHGLYLGDRGLAGKWLGHDTSIRIPLIIFDPRLKESERGSVREMMALMIDLKPTILDWADTPIEDEVQGKSLVPIIKGEKPGDWRTEFFYEHHSFPDRIPPSEGVRTERYKYLRYLNSDPLYEELYDLKVDPNESRNLADNPEHVELLNKMQRKYEKWREKVK